MSAYVLGHDKLDVIVNFVMANPNALLNTPYFYYSGKRLGNTLFKENQRSVIHRYSHNPAIVAETHALSHYSFAAPVAFPHVHQVLAILEEWDYNACECPDYDQSEAAAIWRAIARYAVNFANELQE